MIDRAMWKQGKDGGDGEDGEMGNNYELRTDKACLVSPNYELNNQ